MLSLFELGELHNQQTMIDQLAEQNRRNAHIDRLNGIVMPPLVRQKSSIPAFIGGVVCGVVGLMIVILLAFPGHS